MDRELKRMHDRNELLHTTHFDDCGCKTAKLTEALSLLERAQDRLERWPYHDAVAENLADDIDRFLSPSSPIHGREGGE